MKEKTSIASQKRMTDAQIAEVKRVVGDALRKRSYSKDQGQRIIGRTGEFSKGVGELFDKLAQDWPEKILAKERECHRAFFGQRFSLTSFRGTLEKYGPEKIAEWQDLGLEPHFLPETAMPRDAAFPGWKLKPEDWYFNQVVAGRILRQQPDGSLVPEKKVKLEGITALVDTRSKPPYNGGKQMFKNDNLLGPVIERLRKEDKIAGYNSSQVFLARKSGAPVSMGLYDQSSRFGVSANEWEEHIKPELAKTLGLEVVQVRLERTVEANVIPQLYPDMPRHRDGEIYDLASVWVWYEEFLDGRGLRLGGGRSVYGGFVYVNDSSSACHWDDGGFRPLAVL